MAVINNLGVMAGGVDMTFQPKSGPPQDMTFRKQTGPEPFTLKRVWRGFWCDAATGERLLPIKANKRSFGRDDGATFQPDERGSVWLPVSFIQTIKSFVFWNRDYPIYRTQMVAGQPVEVETGFTVGLEVDESALVGPDGQLPDEPPAPSKDEVPVWSANQIAAQLR